MPPFTNTITAREDHNDSLKTVPVETYAQLQNNVVILVAFVLIIVAFNFLFNIYQAWASRKLKGRKSKQEDYIRTIHEWTRKQDAYMRKAERRSIKLDGGQYDGHEAKDVSHGSFSRHDQRPIDIANFAQVPVQNGPLVVPHPMDRMSHHGDFSYIEGAQNVPFQGSAYS
ncbi:hypothetical protein DM02DRAFT_633659 [Periconia macrospinosa]|uniref:Uncharacterized protein n=1 Tax=Periconia macrospinosa TaxID=97972 RepID=A0A2V1D8Q1_9PLEO|nr:hypothetical protein DM02DRAFT_633659 [Periconia macrospinosa]